MKFSSKKPFFRCIRQNFSKSFDENCRRYVEKYLFFQCSKYATMAVEGLIKNGRKHHSHFSSDMPLNWH